MGALEPGHLGVELGDSLKSLRASVSPSLNRDTEGPCLRVTGRSLQYQEWHFECPTLEQINLWSRWVRVSDPPPIKKVLWNPHTLSPDMALRGRKELRNLKKGGSSAKPTCTGMHSHSHIFLGRHIQMHLHTYTYSNSHIRTLRTPRNRDTGRHTERGKDTDWRDTPPCSQTH